ncbi:MAG: nucleotide sugar dehydrogenase [candidate division WOR-3 bacterium]
MLVKKIKEKKASIGIIGMGYVGLPLGVEIAKAGFKILGVDLDKEKIHMINKGKSYISDVTDEELSILVEDRVISATYDYSRLGDCDIILICVPTPVTQAKEPDVSYIIDAGKRIVKILRREQLIVLKSTTYPFTTQEVLLPILNKKGLKVGQDYYLAFVPERIDPGNKEFGIRNTPAVIGGVTPRCTELCALFYEQFVEKVVKVSSPAAAELTKLLENVFRNINIALVNEFALLCERIGGLNIWEIVEAARTKPFGYMPFYPGPGVGGHCIPIDPYYLSWKARCYDFHTSFIELAAKINEDMPFYVVDKIVKALSKNGLCPAKSRVFVLGVTFKKDINDLRHSPSLRVIEILEDLVGEVVYHDPYINEFRNGKKIYRSIKLDRKNLKDADCVVILTDHSKFKPDFILKHAKLVVDTRNLIKQADPRVVKLGAG